MIKLNIVVTVEKVEGSFFYIEYDWWSVDLLWWIID